MGIPLVVFILASYFFPKIFNIDKNHDWNKLRSAVVMVGNEPNNTAFGSGFFISPEGLLITNAHTTKFHDIFGIERKKLFVYTENYEVIYEAELIRYSECNDLALWKVKNPYNQIFPYISLGNSPNVKSDAWILGYYDNNSDLSAITAKVVGFNRKKIYQQHFIDNTIVLDEALSKGSSGGPVVDEKYKLIGVTFFGDTKLSENIAINVEQVKKFLEFDGVFHQGWGLTNITNIEMSPELVTDRPIPDSPADLLGVKKGDKIISIETIEHKSPLNGLSYCKFQRTNDSTQQLQVQVRRDGDIYDGVINSSDRLEKISTEK